MARKNKGDLLDYIWEQEALKLDFKKNSVDHSMDKIGQGQTPIAIKLRLFDEFLDSYRINPRRKNTLRYIIETLKSNGIAIVDHIAVYPQLDSPQYVLPFYDGSSHKFLIEELLLPRRYSLTYLLRIKLRIYAILLRFMKLTTLHPFCYLIVRRND